MALRRFCQEPTSLYFFSFLLLCLDIILGGGLNLIDPAVLVVITLSSEGVHLIDVVDVEEEIVRARFARRLHVNLVEK